MLLAEIELRTIDNYLNERVENIFPIFHFPNISPIKTSQKFTSFRRKELSRKIVACNGRSIKLNFHGTIGRREGVAGGMKSVRGRLGLGSPRQWRSITPGDGRLDRKLPMNRDDR